MLPARQLLRRHVRTIVPGPGICVWCQTGTRQYAAAPAAPSPKRQARAHTPTPISTQQLRLSQDKIDSETRERMTFFNGARADDSLWWEPAEAEGLLREYNRLGFQGAIDKYKVTEASITNLALNLLKLPSAKPYASAAHAIGRHMLLDCSRAKQSDATLHMLARVNQYNLIRHGGSALSNIRNHDLAAARQHLEELANKERNPEAMVLLGQYLEQEGKSRAAKTLYEDAMDAMIRSEANKKKRNTKADPASEAKRIQAQKLPLPLIAPWNALGNLFIQEGDIEQATRVFEVGATEADDPLAYYYRALLETGYTVKWLNCMTKAAASGHVDAAFKLGEFYLAPRSQVNEEGGLRMRRDLHWLDIMPAPRNLADIVKPPTWRDKLAFGLGSNEHGEEHTAGRFMMAFEWLSIAESYGHKGAYLLKAKWNREHGRWVSAARLLLFTLERPEYGTEEQYPEAVKEAMELLRNWQSEDKRAGRHHLRETMKKFQAGIYSR